MIQQVLNSHAKINVGLRIRGMREDGYHEIETIFYPLRLRDVVTISLVQNAGSGSNSVILKSNKSYIPLNRDNLCYIAFEKFFRAFRIRDSYSCTIDIEKNIPVSGGLGGGSSNAAAVIKFLVRTLNIDVKSNREKLIETAREIGSDVPFFLLMRPCYAEGRGEIMRELPGFRINYDILAVNPNARVSTRWAFEKLAMKGLPMKPKMLDKVTAFAPEQNDLFVNEFEPVIFLKQPHLREIKDTLIRYGAVYASLSGSGATLYGLFRKEHRSKVRILAESLQKEGCFTYLSYPH